MKNHIDADSRYMQAYTVKRDPAESANDEGSDSGLNDVANISQHIDKSGGDPGMHAAHVDDGGPFRAEAQVVRRHRQCHQHDSLHRGMNQRHRQNGGGGDDVAHHWERALAIFLRPVRLTMASDKIPPMRHVTPAHSMGMAVIHSES